MENIFLTLWSSDADGLRRIHKTFENMPEALTWAYQAHCGGDIIEFRDKDGNLLYSYRVDDSRGG